MPEKSRLKLTRDFLIVFKCPRLLNQTELIAFLEQHELGCFIKKDTLLKPIMIKDAEDAEKIQKLILCLPIGRNLSDVFVEKLSQLIRQTMCPIILYWIWQLPNNEGYVALRISFERLNETIQFQTEILHPAGFHFSVTPIHQLVDKLASLMEYRFISINPEDSGALVIGDKFYWTALSLFLRLSQDAVGYQTDFIKWQQNNQSITEKIGCYVDQNLLSVVSYMNAPLFYSERALIILKMDFFQDHILDRLMPTWSNSIPFQRLIRIAVLSYIVYHAHQQEEYLTLCNIPLIAGLYYLMTRMTKNASEGFSGLILFYVCQFFLTASYVGFNFYMQLSGTEIQRSIIAPRYIFQWMAEMTKEMIKLPIRFLGMIFFFSFICLLEKLLHQKLIHTENNQAGFRAIAFLTMQFFISWIEKNLPEFNSWIFRQQSEEAVLFLMHNYYQSNLTIKNSIITRVLQQLFFSNQTIAIKAKNMDVTTTCQIEISHSDSTSCSHYALDCISRFFQSNVTNETFALAKMPTAQKWPTQQWRYCKGPTN